MADTPTQDDIDKAVRVAQLSLLEAAANEDWGTEQRLQAAQAYAIVTYPAAKR